MPPQEFANKLLKEIHNSVAHPVKETEENLFSTTEYENETLLAPLHHHSCSGLSPSCHLLLQGMGRGT